MRILLAEDDPMIGNSVLTGLRRLGYSVDWVQDGVAADLALREDLHCLLLLDLGLPRKDGVEVLKSLRSRHSAIPVIILTARDTVTERVAGLDAGADDYLVKPFDLDELAARVRALLRRKDGRADPLIEIGDLCINPKTREVRLNGQPVALSGRESAVLLAIAERPGMPLSRSQIEDRLYGWGDEIESNAVEVHIHSLRKKLGAGRIVTIRGVGYLIPKP